MNEQGKTVVITMIHYNVGRVKIVVRKGFFSRGDVYDGKNSTNNRENNAVRYTAIFNQRTERFAWYK